MKRILVVDDMAVFREPIAASLRSKGYDAVCAENGVEALKQLRQGGADLMLLDVAMPVMDGLSCLESLRQNAAFKELPVILLTAVAERDHVVNAARFGVRDYLLKSNFSLVELESRIHHHLAQDADETTAASAVMGRSPTRPIDEAIQSIKDLRPIMKRSQVQEQLDACGELKGLSPTVGQILEALRQKECSIERLAKVVQQDQAVAMRILKLANSAVYTRGEPVDSVQKAITRIGLEQIRQVVMNISVIDHFGGNGEDDRLNNAQFWEHSIATGLITADLTRAREGVKESDIDAAFTMGLLHDVGRMVYADLFAEHYTTILDAADQLQLPLEQVESRMLLINHADAMDRILHAWQFPRGLINPIALHHLSAGNIRRISPNAITETATLALANRLAHAMLLGSSGNLAIYPTDELVATLRIDPSVIQRIEDQVPSQTDDIKFAMLARANEQGWPSMRDQLRDQLAAPLRPVCICADPQTNPVRMLIERLQDSTDAEQPNVAVVHLTHQRDCAPRHEELLQAQEQLGVAPLPTVVLSPSGELQLPGRRADLCLPMPVSLLRLIDGLNRLIGDQDASIAA